MYWAHAVVSALDEESASDQQQLSSGEQFGNVEHLAGMHPADRRVEPVPAGHDGQSGGGHGRLVERVSQLRDEDRALVGRRFAMLEREHRAPPLQVTVQQLGRLVERLTGGPGAGTGRTLGRRDDPRQPPLLHAQRPEHSRARRHPERHHRIDEGGDQRAADRDARTV